MRQTLLFATALFGLYAAPAGAQQIANPKILEFGAGRSFIGSGPDALCVTDRSGACQQFGMLPQSGGPVMLTPGQMSVAGPSSMLVYPQGNPYPTFSALSAQSSAVLPFGTTTLYPFPQAGTQRLSGREYLVNLGMTDGVGGYPYPLGSPQSLNDPTDKVTLYAGMDCQQGGAPCWTINTSLVIDRGFAALGHGATGYELDVNNNDQDSGGGDGLGGMVEPGYYGISLAGAGQYAVTAAVGIGGPGTHAIWHRGLVDSNNAIDQCLVCEYGNALRVIDARGVGASALDTTKGTYNQAVNVALGQAAISASRPDGTGGLQALTVGTDGSVNLAPIGATSVTFGGNISPIIANGQFLASKRSDTGNNGAQIIGLGNDNFVKVGQGGTSGITLGIAGAPININGTPIQPLATPASSAAACSTGQYESDASYHYVCVAQNTWKRVALTAF